jgi:hypothetical protein
MNKTKEVKTNLSIETYTRFEEIEKLRELWERLQYHPNNDMDFYLHTIKSRDEIISPYIVKIMIGDRVLAIILGRLEVRSIELKLGYKVVAKKKIKAYTIIYKGLLGENLTYYLKDIVTVLVKELKINGADLIFFSNVEKDSKLSTLLKTMPAFIIRDHFTIPNIHWLMSAPKDIDDYFNSMSSKRRKEFRRYERVLNKKWSSNVEFKSYNSSNDVNKICDYAERITKMTYHRGLNVGFVNNYETVERLSIFARKDVLRAFFLFLNGQPCAYWIGTIYNKTIYLDYTGFKPEYAKLQIGTISFNKMIEELCIEGISRIDFGFGDAFYKKRICDKCWYEESIYIYSLTINGIIANIFRTITEIITFASKRIVKLIKLDDIVKKRWRQVVTPDKK